MPSLHPLEAIRKVPSCKNESTAVAFSQMWSVDTSFKTGYDSLEILVSLNLILLSMRVIPNLYRAFVVWKHQQQPGQLLLNSMLHRGVW